jgi:hypothetical protein
MLNIYVTHSFLCSNVTVSILLPLFFTDCHRKLGSKWYLTVKISTNAAILFNKMDKPLHHAGCFDGRSQQSMAYHISKCKM